jgi:hypothetical protein
VIPDTFDAQTKVILQALKTYGMIVADNGSNWFISGAQDPHWNDDLVINQLRQVVGSNFEVVKMEGMVTAGAPQTITFTSTPPTYPAPGSTYTVSATGGDSGNPVTFSLAPSSANVCSISGAEVTFNDANGTCIINADQAGGDNGGVTYDFGTQAQQIIKVGGCGSSSPPIYGCVKDADPGVGASLNGDVPFPADNAWNRDISADEVDPNSDALVASIGLATNLHPDFGTQYGMSYMVVPGSQPLVPINFTAYGDESDPGPYPIPADAPGEGGADAPLGSARHVLVIDRDNQKLYELFSAFPNTDGSWNADSGAVFDLISNVVRPGGQPGWTSADAAGLPIFPGLARYDEVASGAIHHALRFTVQRTRRAYVPPAVHWASQSSDPNLPPMGMRVRLKASYTIPDGFDAQTKVILQALKTYGMILADNGSNWFISGAPDSHWSDEALVDQLRGVAGSNFEVVRMNGLVTPEGQPLSPQAITGAWYDPAYTGSGFNTLMTDAGLLLYYYGWDKDGNRLWLMSNPFGPTQIVPGAPITITLVQTNGGKFLTPAIPGTYTTWGTLTINFAAGGATAIATLSGKDGDVALDLRRLIGIAGAL